MQKSPISPNPLQSNYVHFIPILICKNGETFGRNIENPVLRQHQCAGIIDHWYAKFIFSLQRKATKDNHTEK